MHQELARPRLLMAELPRRRIGANMNPVQEDLAVLHASVTVAQIGLVRAQRLDLRTDQRNSGLVRLLYEEVVARLPILDHEIDSRLLSILPSHGAMQLIVPRRSF